MKEVAQAVKIQNPAGTAAINITYYKINGYSYLKTITDSVGRVVTFNYDYTKRNLLSIATDTRTISYTYQRFGTTDPIDVLKTVTPPVGNSWSYNYDSTYELNELNYPTGGKNAYTYSDISFKIGDSCSIPYRVVTQKVTSGRGITSGTWTFNYNSGGSNITVINGPGVSETHKFFGWGSGNISAGTVWKVGLPISRNYNFNGATLAESFTWSTGASVSNTQISNINWGCPGFLVSDSGVFPAFLSSKSTTRDGKTYTTNYSSFNTYGDPQTVTETGDVNRTRSLAYCTNPSKNIVKGKPVSESVSGSFTGTGTTTWTYGASDCINPTQIVKDGVTKNISYDASGNLSSITDANSHTMSYLWSNGRISKATNPIYYISRIINIDGTIQSETNGRGYKTSYAYDKNLRLTGITPPVGNATNISYAADSSTRTETRGSYSVTNYFDGFARPTGSLDSKGATTTIAYLAYGVKDYTDSNIGDKTTYDYFGRAKQVLHKDNNKVTYAYSGSNVVITDENNANTTFTYKAFGNPDEKHLTSVLEPTGTTTSYTRNIRNDIAGIAQGNLSHSFGYNTKYFLTSETHPETGTITYGRDNVGNMTSKTDATGTKNYGFDAIDRLTSITSGSSSISLGYDNANNRTSLTSPAATLTFGYDTANRLTSKNETIAGKAYLTLFGYDNNDNITSITYPSGRVVGYGYNGNNQVTSVTGFGGSVSSVTYNTAGLPTAFSYSNGIINTLTYNSRNLTTGINAGSAVKLTYGYDSRGNTSSITDNLSSLKNQVFGYDSLNRITNFSGAWGSGSYGYDNYGNRTSKSVGGTSSYTYSSNRLNSVSGTEAASYNYNGNGALTGGSWGGSNYTLSYDAFGNLANYNSGSTVLAGFGYDGDGIRVSKASNGKNTIYHYNLANQVLTENYSDGQFIADYVYMNGKLIAKVAAIPIISVTPTTDSFGNTYVNTASTTHSFTIRNSGTANLVIGLTSISGNNSTEFVKTADTCSGQTIVPSASCTLGVAFAPASTGAKTANISIGSNDPSTPILAASLNGIGVYPVLTVTKAGSGTGTVTSIPSGISCGNTCTGQFATVSLSAAPDALSSFTGWSGSCTGTAACAPGMTADANVTATFVLNSCSAIAKIGSIIYPTISSAFAAAVNGDTIKLFATDVTVASLPNISMTLDGGYLCDFSSNPGMTTLHGAPHITTGTVNMKNIRVSQ